MVMVEILRPNLAWWFGSRQDSFHVPVALIGLDCDAELLIEDTIGPPPAILRMLLQPLRPFCPLLDKGISDLYL